MLKQLVIVATIFILIMTVLIIYDYESISYEVETEGRIFGFCVPNTCYGIITNNETITNINNTSKEENGKT